MEKETEDQNESLESTAEDPKTLDHGVKDDITAEEFLDPVQEEISVDSESFVQTEGHDEADDIQATNPALTINIQSWMTPIVGIAMLLIGIVGGYFLRPALSPELDLAGTESASTEAQAPLPAQPQAAQPAEQPQQSQSQVSVEDREALMAALLPQVRHFRGDPEAPVTLIEFSDFQ